MNLKLSWRILASISSIFGSSRQCLKYIELVISLDLKSGLPLNIIHLMIDSQSHANFERQLIKTMPVLHGDPNTIIFDGHTIVADGTTGQLTAAFTGMKVVGITHWLRKYTGKYV